MLEGLSRFLVQHERCGAGFDVAHPAGLGSGRVSITCRGCGARHEYATATIEVERELRIEPAPPPQPAPPLQPAPGLAIPPRPAPYPESGPRIGPGPPAEQPATQPAEQPATRPPAERIETAAQGAGNSTGLAGNPPPTAADPGSVPRVEPRTPSPPRPAPRRPSPAPRRPSRAGVNGEGRSFWRSPQATAALIMVAALAFAFAAVRIITEAGDSDRGGTAATPSQEAADTPSPATVPEQPAQSPAPEQPAPGPTPVPQPGDSGAAGSEAGSAAFPTRTVRTQRFALRLPVGWSQRAAPGGLLLQPRGGGRVNVQIYFQRAPQLSLAQMSGQTAAFLRRQVPGARVFTKRSRAGGQPAYLLTASGPGQTAIAVDTLRGPYRYLVVRRIFAGARPRASRQAAFVVRSFRPS